MSTTTEVIRLARVDNSDPMDQTAATVRRHVFGHLVKIGAPIIESYHSDLYLDAGWLTQFVTSAEVADAHSNEREISFFWGVGRCGTAIGTEPTSVLVTVDAMYRVTIYCTPGPYHTNWYATFSREG